MSSLNALGLVTVAILVTVANIGIDEVGVNFVLSPK